MLGTQLVRRFWPEARGRSERRRCAELFEPGWTRRFQITTRGGGQKHRIYMLTRQGFELLKQHRGPRGPYIDPDARWQEPQIEDPRRVIHDLHVAAWLLAFEALAGERLVRSWRGARTSRVHPPTRREGRERLPLRPRDIPLGGSRRIRDVALEEFKPISPDATIELALSVTSPPHRFDVLLELDRTGRPSGNVEKFHRYDALLTGWARVHGRYKMQGEPPVVVFVVEDEPKARAFIDAADTAITGAVVTPGTAPEHWEYPGRERTFFVCERDVHMATLRSYRLPRYPPEVRKAQRGDQRRSRNRPEPEQLALLERRLLRK
jgi:Replication-relaxation